MIVSLSFTDAGIFQVITCSCLFRGGSKEEALSVVVVAPFELRIDSREQFCSILKGKNLILFEPELDEEIFIARTERTFTYQHSIWTLIEDGWRWSWQVQVLIQVHQVLIAYIIKFISSQYNIWRDATYLQKDQEMHNYRSANTGLSQWRMMEKITPIPRFH